MALDASDINVLREAIHESMDVAQEKIQQTVFSQLEASQEKMAQMIARQFVELKTELQDVQVTVRKVGSRQAQVEADLAEVGRNSELIKRRLSDLHDDLGTGDRVIQEREMALRIDHLEREVGELRSRLSAV